MSLRCVCPHCEGLVGIPEQRADRPVRCLHCGSTFTPVASDVDTRVEAKPALGWESMTETHETDRATLMMVTTKAVSMSPGWRAVVAGLNTIALGVLLSVSWSALGLSACVAAWLKVLPAEVLVAIVVGSTAVGCIAWFLALVGRSWCCAAPSGAAMKGVIVGSAVCTLTSMGLVVTLSVFDELTPAVAPGLEGAMREGLALLAAAILILAGILALSAEVLFLVFLHRIGAHFQSRELTEAVAQYVVAVFVGIFLGVALVFVFVFGLDADRTASAQGIKSLWLLTVQFILSAVLSLCYLYLLRTARRTIRGSFGDPGAPRVSFRQACPRCQGMVGIPNRRIGLEMRCPHCATNFTAANVMT